MSSRLSDGVRGRAGHPDWGLLLPAVRELAGHRSGRSASGGWPPGSSWRGPGSREAAEQGRSGTCWRWGCSSTPPGSSSSSCSSAHFVAAPPSPSLADVFWLGLYPCLIAGLAVLVYRRSADDDAGGIVASTAISTVITIGMGLVAWELVIVPQAVLKDVSVARLLVVTAYPMGDLVLIALALRLRVLGRPEQPGVRPAVRRPSSCFLGADMGWVRPLRTGEPLPRVDPPRPRRHLAGGLRAAGRGRLSSLVPRAGPDIASAACHDPHRGHAGVAGRVAAHRADRAGRGSRRWTSCMARAAADRAPGHVAGPERDVSVEPKPRRSQANLALLAAPVAAQKLYEIRS